MAEFVAGLDEALAEFRDSRYARLSVTLPRLICAGHVLAVGGGSPVERDALLAGIYALTTRMLVKLDDQQLGWMAADRARVLVSGGGEPLAVGEAARNLAVLARKAGWHEQAASIALSAAASPLLAGKSPALAAERGLLIQSAAYTAARAGDRDGMRELTDEAASLAAQFEGRVLLRDHGGAALGRFACDFPDLAPRARLAEDDIDAMLEGADVVIVHEWNDPALVAAIGTRRARGGRFLLLFHDTHHRAVSDPAAIHAFDLSGYDGVLAFGNALAEMYRRTGWATRCFVWHEAADTRLFHPPTRPTQRQGVAWIGNWGDEERSAELRDYLLEPVRALGQK
ncbi:MAG: hypothetical protein ACRDL8_22105, partial [Solirubrobacteraceae bacterium]